MQMEPKKSHSACTIRNCQLPSIRKTEDTNLAGAFMKLGKYLVSFSLNSYLTQFDLGSGHLQTIFSLTEHHKSTYSEVHFFLLGFQ